MPTVYFTGDGRRLSTAPVDEMDACTLDDGCAVPKNITGDEGVFLRGGGSKRELPNKILECLRFCPGMKCQEQQDQ